MSISLFYDRQLVVVPIDCNDRRFVRPNRGWKKGDRPREEADKMQIKRESRY